MISEAPSPTPAWIRRVDALHLRARRVAALHRLAIISRILLALAFLPTGLVKVLGRRFSVLDPASSPVGAFFEAMYQSGFYWNLLGLGQVTAAVLLLIPVTRTLGALLFLPIMANMTAVTWSVGFDGTRWITLPMLLAGIFLVCWDWHRVRSIVVAPEGVRVPSPPEIPGVERVGYLLGTGSGLLLFMALRDFGFLGVPAAVMGVGGGMVAVGLVLAGWVKAIGVGQEKPRDPVRLPLPLALVLATGLVASAGCSSRESEPGDAPTPAAVAASIHLGQVYPSGLAYLDAATHVDAPPVDWPETVLFVALDEGALAAIPGAGLPRTARFLRIERDVTPPEIEGMLPADSPCVPEDYQPGEIPGYAGGDRRHSGWEPAEYFATSEWFGCEREPVVALYEVEGAIEASFRIVAFPSELDMVGFDWTVAGLARPLAAAEAEQVAERRSREQECTLEPRGREDAEQLLTFGLANTPLALRLSSHLVACTSLGEAFLVDVLGGDALLESRTITRWRGNF